MVDPNRKINRLTDRDLEFLEECEREFGLRYSEEDAEFMEHCSKPLPDPPVVDNWQFGGGDGGGNRNHNQHRGGGGNRSHRGWRGSGDRGGGHHRNFRHRRGGRGGGGRYQNGYESRDHSQPSYRRERDQPYPPQPPMNVRRDYGNFVAASKD
ncbi:RNA guanine-N7 methyltransferase activating subunit [Musca vetustissima]|uniref:RNA guanine-N7 methyltransferase activating subunit n=1 Tax=Musca vetustissima TaxID=27455 RepID=UPI002AB70F1D|nr:RNA guanine-N7 methyltransferase activating subunit [Musca vetustissima]